VYHSLWVPDLGCSASLSVIGLEIGLGVRTRRYVRLVWSLADWLAGIITGQSARLASRWQTCTGHIKSYGLLSRQQRTKSWTVGLLSLAGGQATPTWLGVMPVTGR